MAVWSGIGGGYFPSKISGSSSQKPHPKRYLVIKVSSSPPPLLISTDPTHINPLHLKHLYSLCNHSVHRFPIRDPHGRVEPVDVNKLRIAISHSSALVSVFTRPDFDSEPEPEPGILDLGGDWIRRLLPVSAANGRLVGFGRAVTDVGLTASIYDVMVIPTLRGRGIGRMIIRRLIRMLTNRGIYDIAALCNGQERLFFEACGFGNDILQSTTMMYTKTSSNS